MRSKKWCFAFQTFTGLSPLPHQYWVLEFRTSLTKAGDGAKCRAKFADIPCVIYTEVTGTSHGRGRSSEHGSYVLAAEGDSRTKS